MALTTLGSEWPMLTHISWLLKSRKRLPSGVQKYTPLARATGIGSTAACAAYSNIVCFFVSAMMSSPVIVRSASGKIRRRQGWQNRQENGGERGIRTLGRVSPTHAFQACSFNHSDISPHL